MVLQWRGQVIVFYLNYWECVVSYQETCFVLYGKDKTGILIGNDMCASDRADTMRVPTKLLIEKDLAHCIS